MFEIILAIFAGIVSYIIWTRWNGVKLRAKMGLSGPKPNLILGNIPEIAKTMNPQEVFLEWRNRYGNTYGYFIGPMMFVAIHDLEMIREVLVKQFSCFVDRMIFLMNENGLKESLISLHSDQWKQVRNSLSPSFSATKLKKMQHIMWQKTDVLMEKCERFAESKKSCDIYDAFQALTLDVIGKCAFAIDCDCQTNPNDPFLVNGQKFFKNADFTQSKLFALAIMFPELDKFWSLLNRGSAMGQAEKVLLDGLKSVYDERLKTYKNFKSVDILQLLLQQRENDGDEGEDLASENGWHDETLSKKKLKLTDSAILSNSYTFLLAGYETTSTALGFTAWLMAKFPEAQKKLQAEIDEFCHETTDINYDTLHKMPYLDAVFKESLRYYPPVVTFVARTCIEDCSVNGVTFVPGVQVMIPIYLIHHDPEIWPDPENFLPERFIDNPDHHPMAWLPFGGGPRNCIGLRFAELEYKICLVKMLKRFNIEKGPEFQDPIPTKSTNALLRPSDKVSVLLTKRT